MRSDSICGSFKPTSSRRARGGIYIYIHIYIYIYIYEKKINAYRKIRIDYVAAIISKKGAGVSKRRPRKSVVKSSHSRGFRIEKYAERVGVRNETFRKIDAEHRRWIRRVYVGFSFEKVSQSGASRCADRATERKRWPR